MRVRIINVMTWAQIGYPRPCEIYPPCGCGQLCNALCFQKLYLGVYVDLHDALGISHELIFCSAKFIHRR